MYVCVYIYIHVVVGEVLRRVTAKTLCASFQDQARSYLWPLQMGVAQPLGTEVGLQVARQWCFRTRDSPNRAHRLQGRMKGPGHEERHTTGKKVKLCYG